MTTPAIAVPPRWRIVASPTPPDEATPAALDLIVAKGPGFGDGTHDTTCLCLQAIAALAPRDRPWRMLDFGSGSGVLSIAAARLGALVDAVEIDPLAVAHAARNADLNAVAHRIRPARSLDDAPGPFDLVVANILRAVLLDFAPSLVARLAPRSTLVLSGLLPTDVPEVGARYARHLGDRRPQVHERGEWCGLVWRPMAPAPAEK